MEGAVHSLVIEDCKRVSATAIESVDAFSPSQIVLSYQGGRIIVSGSGMKIVAFSKGSGAFSATGKICGARYSAKGLKFTGRLFK